MAIALMVALVTIVLFSLSKMNEKKALDASFSLAVSVISEARSRTLSGVGGSQYGVHVEEGSITLFVGPVYSPLDSQNAVSELHSLTAVRNISFLGGGSDVVFDKLTGATPNTGTFEVFLKSDPTQYKIVSISTNGIAEEN